MKQIPLLIVALSVLGCHSHSSIVDELMKPRTGGEPIAPVTQTFGPMTLDEAYAVQEQLAERIDAPRTGWKVGFTSKASQAAWGIDAPAYGPLYDFQQVDNGGSIDPDAFHFFHIEVEIAFIVGKTIDRTFQRVEQIKPYVQSVHVALDIPDNRFDPKAKRDIADLVADGVGAHRYAVGPAHDPSSADMSVTKAMLTRNGKVHTVSDASDVMGDPWEVLVWLANQLHARGMTLNEGDVVLTGAIGQYYAGAGEAAVGEYVGRATNLDRVAVTVR